MRKREKKRVWISILKGILLIVVLWWVNAFIAFVPFSRESNTRLIILTWLVVDFLFIYFLARVKQLNWISAVSAIMFTAFLAVMYFAPLNSNFPQEALNLNKKISEENLNKYDYAKNLFFEVEKKYGAPIRQYLLEPWKVFFIRDFSYYWNLPDGEYADSSIQGQMYRNLLIQSGRFKEEEVTKHQGFCSNSPHLLIKIIGSNKEEIWVDFWAVDNFPGVESNETYEFGMRAKRPCNIIIGEAYK